MKTRIEGESRLDFPALVNADRNDGFDVFGEGTIDGSGGAYWKRLVWRSQWRGGAENMDEQRPRLLYVSNSRNVRIRGLELKNSAFWTTHFYRCEDVELEDLRIYTEVVDGVQGQNPDAADLDGVKRVRIRRVYMDVPNDAVTAKGGKGPDVHDPRKSPESAKVEDVIIEDCTFGPQCTGCLTLGSECFYAKNITLRSCKVENPVCVLRLKMRPDTKQEYGQIHVSDISGSCAYALIVKAYTTHARPEWKGLHIPSRV
jgi:polygalacturonase